MAPRVGSSRRGRRLPRDADDRHERRRLVLRRARRGAGLGRAGLPAPAARADLERHPLDVGARGRAAAMEHRRRRQRMRSLSEPVVDDVDPGTVPTALEPGSTNAVGRMLGLLGDEWTLLILQRALRGTTRYGQFLDEVADLQRGALRPSRDDGARGGAPRVVYQERPVRAEYVLTSRGRGLWPVTIAIWDWERRWVPRHAADAPRDAARAVRAGLRPGPDLQDVPRGRPLQRRARRVGAERVMGAVRAGVDDPTPVRPAAPTGPSRASSPRRCPSSATGGPRLSSAPPCGGSPASATSWTPWPRRRASSPNGCGPSATSACSRPGGAADPDAWGARSTT